MKARKIVIGAVLVIVGLPVVLVLIAAAWIYLQDRTNGTIVSSGQERSYLLHVPRSYDRVKPTPLVISLHAAAEWPAQQMNLSRWNQLADERGFIVVYASGAVCPRSGMWTWGLASPGTRFIAALIDTLEAAYDIDPTMIYANGVSDGGAWRLCCPARCPIGSRRSVWWLLLNHCRGAGAPTIDRCR